MADPVVVVTQQVVPEVRRLLRGKVTQVVMVKMMVMAEAAVPEPSVLVESILAVAEVME
jgi:hypothetical protein